MAERVSTDLTSSLVDLRAEFEAKTSINRPDLKGDGGGGTSGGMTDDWKASVDRQLAQLHGDVRNLLYGIVGAAVVLAGMLGGLYLHTDGKFEAEATKAQSRAEKLDDRLTKIETTLTGISVKLEERAAKPQGQ